MEKFHLDLEFEFLIPEDNKSFPGFRTIKHDAQMFTLGQ
jgi:hypothetical protein